MALDFYMEIQGAKTKFPGTSNKKGHTNEIPGFSWTYQVTSPRDAASGLPTGKRQHRPLTVVTATGASSPLFLQALCTNETLKQVTLSFWTPNKMGGGSASGTEVLFYVIILTNATISSVRQHGALNLDANLMKLPELDEIEFTFEKISWEYKGGKGNVIASDDWSGQYG